MTKRPVGLMWYLVPESTMFGRHNGIDDVLLHVRAKLLGGDVVVVLGRDHHGVDALGLAVDVLHADLALAVGPQVAELAEAADLAQLPAPACAPS